jgi:hypothetical protein
MFQKSIFKNISFILIIGLLIRLFFAWYFGQYYFKMQLIYWQGDTAAWANCFHNWYYYGTFSTDLNLEYGPFGRMPVYSFIMGFFYLIFQKDWLLSAKYLSYFQIIIDLYSVYLFYKIAKSIFKNEITSSIAAWLICLYPFSFVWAPVCYTETFSLFFLIIAFYFITVRKNWKFAPIFTGVFISLATLSRPQLGIAFPIFGLYYLLQQGAWKSKIVGAVQYGLAVFLVFGSWPMRNYFVYHKIIVTQDLRGFANWNGDMLAFTSFIYSAQAGWEPQFSQIRKNQAVDFPRYFKGSHQDSLQLQRAFELSKTCGSSFSHWKIPAGKIIYPSPCTDTIVQIFTDLRAKQIKNNPWAFYVILPLQNFSKAVFKTELTNAQNIVQKLASLLFYYRTLLLLLGLIGCMMMIRNSDLKLYAILVLSYWGMLYFALCAGTGPMFRNIEMRYFMHPDVMMLLPGAYVIARLLERFKSKN